MRPGPGGRCHVPSWPALRPSRHWRVNNMTVGIRTGDSIGGKTSLFLHPTRQGLTGKGGSSVDGVPSSAAPAPEVWEENPQFCRPWSAGAPTQGTADSPPPLGVEGAPGAHCPHLGTPQPPGAPPSSPHPHASPQRLHTHRPHTPGGLCGSLEPGGAVLQSHDLLGLGQMTHFSSFPRIGVLPAGPIRGRLRPRVDYSSHRKDQEAFVSQGEQCTRGWAPSLLGYPYPTPDLTFWGAALGWGSAGPRDT